MFRRLRGRRGLTAIEYGVFAAFIVLMLVAAAAWMGPQLRDWLKGTVTCITDRKNTTGAC